MDEHVPVRAKTGAQAAEYEGGVPSLDAQALSRLAAQRAAASDVDGAFPADDIRDLHRHGFLHAPFPSPTGEGLAVAEPERLCELLKTLGRGSLALGRLYEGHVNAVALVVRYGTADNLKLLVSEADAGRPSGVWMAGEPLRLEQDRGGRLVLKGRKILCSGAGHFRRPLVAADGSDGSIMLIPHVEPARADTSGWTAHGMRATATGTVDFSGIVIEDDEIVGRAGDYLRSPYFRGGAWRVLAVQLGGLEAILEEYRAQLEDSPHRDHPIQLARFGDALAACETARLWVWRSADIAESSFDDPEAVDAYVDLARNAFETAALCVVGCAQKAIGLKAFMRPNPLERLTRDLATYLRQPALDMSLVSAAGFHLRQGDRTA